MMPPNNRMMQQEEMMEPVDSPIEESQEPQEQLDELTGLPKRVVDNIITCYNFYRNEDKETRNVMLAFWKRLDNMWNGIQRTFWDYQLNDWRRIPVDESDEVVYDPVLYDKGINIYRAHGEALIAALSIKPPSVNFYPDDADVIEDVDTAKAYSKIYDLIVKHNGGNLLLMKALFLLFNQGVVAAYIYNRANEKNGSIRIPQYGDDIHLKNYTATCPACGEVMSQETVKDDQAPNISDLEMCPNCVGVVEPIVDVEEEFLPQIVGYVDQPKSRTKIDIFGPLHVHIPFYAREQEHIPYLHLRFEQHATLLRSIYPKLKDRIPLRPGETGEYDRTVRMFTGLQYSTSNSLVTTTCQWLRPWSFECLPDEEAKYMKEKYPDGCYSVILNNNLVAECRGEDLDDHWMISENPLANTLHADPLGKPLAPIQEIENDINDLTLDTFLHSIPETFANPKVLDFGKYKDAESKPGMVFPATPEMGKGLADGFHTLKTATLSDEMDVYDKSIMSKGQFVSGSFPSIYGGPATTGSKTASEYTESRAMALQRLNITWTFLKKWWAGIAGKAVVQFADAFVEDEKFVEKSDKSTTGFVNVWIRQAELTGKIGRVEPDVDEELPVTTSQIRGILMELLTLNSDYLNEALFHPANAPIIKRAIGIPDAYVPGQDNRDKQYAEFADILNGIPVAVDPDVDDHLVHIQTCKSWLVSSSGLATAKTNPEGYNAVKMHMMEHIALVEQLTVQKPEGPDSAIASART